MPRTSPRLAIQQAKDDNRRQAIFRLPQELHDMWIGRLYSTADIRPGDSGYVGPQRLDDLRNTSQGLRNISNDVILKRNFEHLELKLEAHAFNGTGDIDALLRKMHDFRHCGDAGTYVKTIRFLHHQSQIIPGVAALGVNLTIPILSNADRNSLRAQLSSLLT